MVAIVSAERGPVALTIVLTINARRSPCENVCRKEPLQRYVAFNFFCVEPCIAAQTHKHTTIHLERMIVSQY